MDFSNLTVRARLLLGFGILAAIVLLVSLLSMRALGAGHEDYASYVNETAERITFANDVLDATNARAISARNLVLVATDADRAAEKTAVGKAHEKVRASLDKLKKAMDTTPGVTDQERKLLEAMEAIESRYGPVALEIVNLALSDKRDEAVAKMNNDCRPLLAALIKASNALIEHDVAAAEQQVKAADAAYASNRNLMMVACALSVGLAVAMALGITRSITRALGAEPAQLGAAAHRVASGDLSTVQGGAGAPEGSVLASLAEMQASLARVVGEVRNASDSIATGSAQIATGNTDLSQRTEQQASNVQQTASSMEQMSATVRNNADTAKQATQLATSASAAATKGGELVGLVVATMDDITASSRKISDIIGVIDGIAFQTNILALNAAVEAARAGEQGRGFAVVAAEVRNLAQRSAEAAKEIKALINTSVEKVEAGSKQVDEAGTTMGDIVSQVKRVADLIADISAATIEQTSGIGQVSDAVTQMDQVTQQNAALVEESAAAAESLRQQAAQLAQIVGVFRLDNRHSPVASPMAARPEAPRQAIKSAPKATQASRDATETWESF